MENHLVIRFRAFKIYEFNNYYKINLKSNNI